MRLVGANIYNYGFMVYGTSSYSLHGLCKPKKKWGPHIVGWEKVDYDGHDGTTDFFHGVAFSAIPVGGWLF